jgi:hypothetical protein
MQTTRTTIYDILKRWATEGQAGLEDKSHAPHEPARKVTFQDIQEVRRLNASRQDLRDNSKMGKKVRKIEEKEENCVSPNHLTPMRCSTPCRTAEAL